MKTVEFFFDFGSPATYLAHTQLPRLAAEAGATLAYRPMLLGGVFKATVGLTDAFGYVGAKVRRSGRPVHVVQPGPRSSAGVTRAGWSYAAIRADHTRIDRSFDET